MKDRYSHTLDNCFFAKQELIKKGFTEGDFFLADEDYLDIGYLLGEPMLNSNDDFFKSALQLWKELELSQQDDDSFFDYWLEQQEMLSEAELAKKLEDIEKCADWILKKGIGVNLDNIY